MVVSLSGFMDAADLSASDTNGNRRSGELRRLPGYLCCESRSVVMVSVETTGDGIVVVVCSDVVVWL